MTTVGLAQTNPGPETFTDENLEEEVIRMPSYDSEEEFAGNEEQFEWNLDEENIEEEEELAE